MSYVEAGFCLCYVNGLKGRMDKMKGRFLNLRLILRGLFGPIHLLQFRILHQISPIKRGCKFSII